MYFNFVIVEDQQVEYPIKIYKYTTELCKNNLHIFNENTVVCINIDL